MGLILSPELVPPGRALAPPGAEASYFTRPVSDKRPAVAVPEGGPF